MSFDSWVCILCHSMIWKLGRLLKSFLKEDSMINFFFKKEYKIINITDGDQVSIGNMALIYKAVVVQFIMCCTPKGLTYCGLWHNLFKEFYNIYITYQYTVQCHHNSVQFIAILHMALWWQQKCINETSNSQQTPHTAPSRASYGASIMRILKKIDRVIMAQHCIWN